MLYGRISPGRGRHRGDVRPAQYRRFPAGRPLSAAGAVVPGHSLARDSLAHGRLLVLIPVLACALSRIDLVASYTTGGLEGAFGSGIRCHRLAQVAA